MSDVEPARAERPYHHGDLKSALLQEAESILERHGIQALTLRAAARAAGVSHAAPANHFGDLTGLLSELAAVGFKRFAQALTAAGASEIDRTSSAKAVGQAYVAFARTYPGMFLLMFRSERLEPARPALCEAMAAAAAVLRSVSGATQNTPFEGAARAAAYWSLVHGFAMLLLDGRLDPVIAALPNAEQAEELLGAVLRITRIGD